MGFIIIRNPDPSLVMPDWAGCSGGYLERDQICLRCFPLIDTDRAIAQLKDLGFDVWFKDMEQSAGKTRNQLN